MKLREIIFTASITTLVVCTGFYAYDILSKGSMTIITAICIFTGVMSLIKKGE